MTTKYDSDIQFRNVSGDKILRGSPVMLVGAVGQHGLLTGTLMDASDTANAEKYLGVAVADVIAGANGHVRAFGDVRAVDTSAWEDGDMLYCDPETPGALTATKPTSGLVFSVAIVSRVHADHGVLQVKSAPTQSGVVTAETNSLTGGSKISGPILVDGGEYDGSSISLKTVGDSRFDGSTITATAANSTIALNIGDLVKINSGPHVWAEYLSGGAVRLEEDYAVLGTKTALLAGQIDLATATGSANEVIAILSSANDRAVAPVVPSDETIANIDAAVSQITGTGRRALVCLEPPQRGSYWTGIMPAEWTKTIAAQRAIVAKKASMVRAADFATPVLAGNGSVFAAGSVMDPYYDVVHPKLTGGIQWGQAMLDGLGDWVAPFALKQKLGEVIVGNAVTNPEMAGSSGTGVGGSSVDSWTVARAASNSWTATAPWGADALLWASSTAYALGDRFSVPGVDACDFLVTTAGTSGATAPTWVTTLFGTTTDGTAVVTAIPKFYDFDGSRGVTVWGLGSATNTRATVAQDIDIATAGLAVGDIVEGSIFHSSLLHWYGFQLEIQAMAGTTKIKSAIGLCASYANVPSLYPGVSGKIITPKLEIPETTTAIRFRVHLLSRTGFNQMHVLTKPVLRKI